MATIMEKAFDRLEAPPARLTGPDVIYRCRAESGIIFLLPSMCSRGAKGAEL